MDRFDSEPSPAPAPTPISPPATNEPVAQSGSFQKPSDYYSTPPAPPGKSGCPKWVPLGCGVGGCLVMILMFAGATLLMSQGGGKLLRFVFSQIKSEIPELVSADVTPAQRQELDRQLQILLQRIDRKQVNLVTVQPVLQKLQSTIGDGSITSDDANEIISALRALNEKPPETDERAKPATPQ